MKNFFNILYLLRDETFGFRATAYQIQ